MGTQRSEDFRDWDIEVETSYSGFDQLGFPFYIWRERRIAVCRSAGHDIAV